MICTLGTTIRAAGSRPAFAAIDRDLPIQVARLARAAGATRYAPQFIAWGPTPGGNFYLRTKAEAEVGIRQLGYPCYTIVRPSLIDAERVESRPAERLGLLAARILRPLIPRRYRAVTATRIAQALLDGVIRNEVGEKIIESGQLQDAKERDGT